MAVYPNGLTTRPYVTDKYGPRIHPITGNAGFHYGTDSINHPDGWNHAPEAGTVTYAGWNGGAGIQVSIQAAGSRLWKIKHHDSLGVSVGDWVNQGQGTGPTGTTGDSTGDHCHLELWIEGVSTDPFAWIANHLTSMAGEIGEPILPEELEEQEEDMSYCVLYEITDGAAGKKEEYRSGVPDNEGGILHQTYNGQIFCQTEANGPLRWLEFSGVPAAVAKRAEVVKRSAKDLRDWEIASYGHIPNLATGTIVYR